MVIKDEKSKNKHHVNAKSTVKQKDVKLATLREQKKDVGNRMDSRKEMHKEVQLRSLAKGAVENRSSLKKTALSQGPVTAKREYTRDQEMKKQVDGAHIVGPKVVKEFMGALRHLDKELSVGKKDNQLVVGVRELEKLSNAYMKGRMEYSEYKKECKDVVRGIKLPLKESRKAHTMCDYLHEAVRCMLKVMDWIVTSVATLGKKREMDHTPGARMMVGRSHFFNPLMKDTKFGALMKDFEHSLDKLDSHTQKHHVKL